jgi:hypothetical protein
LQFKVVTNLRPGLAQRTEQFFLRQLRNVTESSRQTFEALTNSWDNKPVFRSNTSLRGGKIEMSVLTDSDIFHWVDAGTQPHRIPGSGMARMTFPESYTPRTIPGRFTSNAGGGRSGGNTVFAQVVQHPGIEARNFSGRVRAQHMKEVNRVLGGALRNLPL